MMTVPPGAVQASASGDVSTASVVPLAGAWTGKIKLGWPVSFTVNPAGTNWSNFTLRTYVAVNGVCTNRSVVATVSGPGAITAGTFGRTIVTLAYTFSFTGTFTGRTAATGTYAFTNVNGIKGCNQSGTWTASVFSKLSPGNLAGNQSITPTLSWTTMPGATSYQYCIDTVNNGICDRTWINTGTKTSAAVTGLLQNTSYYWQVRAISGATVTRANAGTWWSFKTGWLPGSFGKSKPSSGATYQTLATILSWTASAGAASYQYCFDTVNDDTCNTTWVSAGNVTLVDPPGVFLPGTKYYWQIRAVNSVGVRYANNGSWWWFSTVPPKTLTLQSLGSQDGWVLESTSTSGVGGSQNSISALALGDDRSNRQYRSILSFATGGLPDTAVIVGVTLQIKKSGGSTANLFSALGNIVGDIKKGTFGTSALEKTDFQAVPSKAGALVFTRCGSNNWCTSTMGKANFGYINKTGPTQFRLRFAKDSNNNNAADIWYFFSGETLTGSIRPTLVIQYYVP